MENIRFANKEHEAFYFDMLAATRNNDTFHKAFFYTMGISAETRSHIRSLFDFKEDIIKPEGLSAAWQTGSTQRLCRLAFNLWNGWTEERNENRSTPYELFDCGFAPYFFEAIRLRYPEYCKSMEHPALHFSRSER
jgi:hypothetical protein